MQRGTASKIKPAAKQPAAAASDVEITQNGMESAAVGYPAAWGPAVLLAAVPVQGHRDRPGEFRLRSQVPGNGEAIHPW